MRDSNASASPHSLCNALRKFVVEMNDVRFTFTHFELPARGVS
jgi:hypothetical protein